MAKVIIRFEPSFRLSELCGFPYFIERKSTVEELKEQGIINDDDIAEMAQGKEICKQIPILTEKE